MKAILLNKNGTYKIETIESTDFDLVGFNSLGSFGQNVEPVVPKITHSITYDKIHKDKDLMVMMER